MRRYCLPIEHFEAWAKFNGVKFNNTRVQRIITPDGQQKGSGIFISDDPETDLNREGVLISVPHDLVLSKDFVHEWAKSDVHLHDVLEAIGEFGWVGQPDAFGGHQS